MSLCPVSDTGFVQSRSYSLLDVSFKDEKLTKKQHVDVRIDAEEKIRLEKEAEQKGMSLTALVYDKIFQSMRPLQSPALASVPKPESTGPDLSSLTAQVEPKEFSCLWNYKVYNESSFQIATCEPKSQDNTLTIREIIPFCRICPVALKNRTMLRAVSQKAGDLAAENVENVRTIGRSSPSISPSKIWKCENMNCDFQTQNIEEARAHQNGGYNHWFWFDR
jgi:hypothetical protein